MASQLISIATLTGYGRELEHEADSVGVAALASTRYHPAGMLTFMQKLARQDRLRGFPNYGIYQSHPYANERVAALKSQIARLGYDTSPGALREASGAFVVTVAPTTWNGRPASELRLNGSLLYLVVAGEGDMGQAARAAQMADSLNHLFREAVGFNDVRQSADKLAVLLRGRPVIRVQPDDAAAAGSAEAAADRAYREIIKALWKEKLDREQ
jgi:hypothetical protein